MNTSIVFACVACVAAIAWFVLQLLNDQTPQDTLSEALSVHETLAERRTSSHHLPVRTWEEFVEGCSSSATGTNGAKKTSSVQMPLRLTNVPTFQASMWTPVQHLRDFGRSDIQLQVKMSDNPTFFLGCCPLAVVPAKDYFAHMVRLESSQDGKVGSSQLPKYFYQSCSVDILGGKHAMFEKTLSQQLHKPSSCAPFSTSALRDGQTKSHVWVGSQGVVTPAHYDEMNNVFIQLHGRKRIRLAAPSLWRKAGTFAKFHHQHRNVRHLSVFRELDSINGTQTSPNDQFDVFEVEMQPGEALFIPAFWFHEVETLSKASVSLNIWSPAPEVGVLDALWNMALPYSESMIKDPMQIIPLTVALVINIMGAHETSLESTMETLQNFFQSRYAAVESDFSDERQVIHPQSQEYRRHLQYLQMVQDQSPPFVDLSSSQAGSVLTLDILCGQAAAEKFVQILGCRSGSCTNDTPLVEKLHNTIEEAQDIFATARSVGVGPDAREAAHASSNVTCSEAHDRSILTITLLNYLEDVVAQTVGFDHVGSFLQQCILSQPAAVLEQLMVAQYK